MSSAGSAPQFTATNGPWRTAEFACTIAAMRSLPAPFGPVTRSGSGERATWQASSSVRIIASDSNTMPPSS